MLTEEPQPPLILVVDDDAFIRGMLKNLLEKQGYRVTVATEGMKALKEFQNSWPDLVLMDAVMPIMDGFMACAELKKFKESADVPVIIITSLDDEQSVDKAFEVGAAEYITKPVHWAVLRHRVKTILQARQATADLRLSEARFRGIFEHTAMGIALIDMKGQLIHSNPAIQKMFGLSEESLHHKLFHKFFHPSDTKVEKEFYRQLVNGEISDYQMEKYFFRPKSPMLWARLTTSLVRDANGTAQYFIQMIEDITERKRAEASLRLAAKVFETTSNSVIITDAQGNIVDVNQAFLLSTGYSYEEVLDKNPRFLQSGEHDKVFYEQMWSTVSETGRWSSEIRNRHKNGQFYSFWISMSAVHGYHNEVTHYVAVYSDINALKKDQQRMHRLTHYDALTELPNKLLFRENLTRACRQEERLALLYIDLDNFKQINENYGFDIGDEVLKIIAQRLQQCLREGDSLSRLESDEFGIILSPIHQEYDVRTMTEKVIASVIQPILLSGQTPQVDCNIGICFYPDETFSEDDNIDTIIQRADLAMYLAKDAGTNTYHIYTDFQT